MLAVLTIGLTASQLFGAVAARNYNFEEGTAGETTTIVADSVEDLFFESDSTALYESGHVWLEVGGATNRRLPPGPLKDVVEEFGLSAPALEAIEGEAMFTDVSDGTAFDSPVPGSKLALQFDGTGIFDDVEFGSRGVYVDRDAYNNNDEGSNDNTAESFNLITQAWVYPLSSGEGTFQTVWQAGNEQGSVNITEDGLWDFRSLSSVEEDLDPDARVAVEFDSWTHLGIRRGGNGAELFVNGEQVDGDINPTPANWFGGFASLISLGGNIAGDDEEIFPFTGLVDDFKVVGTADVSWDPNVDLDFFNVDSGGCDPDSRGDLDGNGKVEFADFLILSGNFGNDVDSHEQGDIDCNGKVEFADFLVLSGNFGNEIGAAAVPEPNGLALWGLLPIAGFILRGRSRR